MKDVKKGKSQIGKRRRLGRGLTSLISAPVIIEAGVDEAAVSLKTLDIDPPSDGNPIVEVKGWSIKEAGIAILPHEEIHARSNQPRQHFDEDSLKNLAASMRSAGLMQPILVRPDKKGGYEIIAGERRWRAAKEAGLSSLPVIIRDLDDETCAEWSLIENLQREDLNPIERAEAFQRLVEDYQLTHQELAERVGLNRSSISNHLRLNELDEECKTAVREGILSMGHAKVLLGVANINGRQRLARNALRKQWSVRQLEQATKRMKESGDGAREFGGSGSHPLATNSVTNPQIEALQQRLGEHLGTKIRIVAGRKKGTGKLVIEFFNLDHFESIMQTLQFPLD